MTNVKASRPTLNDVATVAGVSRSTVSLVLRDAGYISAETRARVHDAMLQIGYVYNRGAASMRGGTTRSIGIIAPDSSNLFMGEFTSTVELAMFERDLITVSCHSFEDADRQNSIIRSLLERGVDAIILVPAVDSGRKLRTTLATVDVPVIIAVRPLEGSDLPYVGPDNYQGGVLAAQHLIDHGSRTLAYLGGAATLTPRRDRIRGVQSTLATSDASLILDIPAAPTGFGGVEAMTEVIKEGSIPDGVICHNDSVAFGVYRAMRSEAPDLARRIRVIGFDDVGEAALWEPPLTTLSANASEVGRRTVEVLNRKLSGEADVPSINIAPRLIERASCEVAQVGSETR